MVDRWGPLVSLLLQPKSPSYQQYLTVAASLVQNVSQIRSVFREESTRESLFLHLDRAIPRLEELFGVMDTQDTTEEVADGVCLGFLLPLLRESDAIASLDQLTRMVGCVLPVILAHPSPNLRRVAKALLRVDGLLGRLVAHESYSEVLKQWLVSKNTFLDVDLFECLAERLVRLCNDCDHGFPSISTKWTEVKALKKALADLIESLQKNEKANNERTRDLPLLAGMTKLDADDKKTNRARRDTYTHFESPPDIANRLALFGLPNPESLRAVQLALNELEGDVTCSIMCSALQTFPCRFCTERLTGALSLPPQALGISPGRDPNADIKCDVFGKRIGLWKVLLSDRALKDMSRLARAGPFDRVEQKFRELASGDWKGKDLSTRAGSKQQREEMKIPILQTKLSAKLLLLWQIDIGFYEETSRMMQQLVKVWTIVTPEELPNSINHILLIQQTYGPEAVKMCCERPLQQADGRFLPRQFPDVMDTRHRLPSANTGSEKEIAKSLIEMTNKFYTLTEPVLRSLTDPTGDEEFPLDLSREEMEIVSHFRTSSLILGRSGTGKTTCLVFKILAKYRARLSIPDEKPIRQLLLTRSTYLAAKLQTYTRSLIESQLHKTIFATDPGREFVDSLRRDSYGKMNLTSIFSLKDDDFPFVCTFDSFLDLLENTIRRADRRNFLHESERALRTSDGQRMIDFNIFKTEYWEHFAVNLTSSCSAELVFSEIMGVIKGSVSSADTLVPLSRQEYLCTSCRLAPAFTSESERERVYSAFERYEKLKRQRGETDDMDRVIGLLRSIKETPTLGKLIRRCFEEIYVDEVQDLRCLDIVLLLHCVCDARGVHLAGDTAQCISKDSVFRFSEIKALFHDQYATVAGELGQSELAKPTQFSLSRNYRSHQGILSLASFVMQMLWTGFPDTIDKLDPEIGQLGGPRPIIFAGFDAEILSAKMIGLVKLHDRIADFGAEQVILVRDDASKAMLQKKIGEMALVLTILESKGMEFDDVLLYDFFSGSGLGSSYRCLNLLARGEKNLFDAQKHAALCSELKHLYVAVTRARSQLWLLESSEKSVQPIFECLTEERTVRLVEVVKPKDPYVAEKVKVLRAGGSVDLERWLKRGSHLLHQKNFTDALLCFKKANHKKGITQCQAYLYDQEARACRSRSDTEGCTVNWNKATDLFLEIGLISEASECLENLGEYERAARIWKDERQYERASLLFEKAGLFRRASVCCHLNGSYEAAVEVLRRGDEFDEIIRYLSRSHEKVSASSLRRYSRLCNILLKQGRISTELREQTINMLGTDDEKESFFKGFEMIDQLSDLYRAEGRYRELYYLSLENGNLDTALDVVLAHNLFSVVNPNEIEMTFHYVQAEYIFMTRILGETAAQTYQISQNMAQTTPLRKVALDWEKARQVLASIDDLDAPIELSALEDGLIKDFMCLFMIAFEEQTVARYRAAHLPTDILNRSVQVIQGFTSDDTASLNSLCLLCGIFNIPGQTDKPITLRWQAAELTETTNGKAYHTLTELCERAKRWLFGRLSDVVERFEETSGALWRQESPIRCFNLLTKGYCHKQRANECSFLHEVGDVQHYATKITSLLRICSVYTCMEGLYLQREVMGEEFQTKYLGRRRRWLERLIEELIFVTSFDQASLALVIGKHHIHTDKKLATTTSCLEDLLFHRLRRDWKERSSFTMMLEQVQLAHFLGPQVGARFFRALSKKVGYTIYRFGYDGDRLSIAFRAVKAAEQIRWAAANRKFHGFCTAVEIFLRSVQSQMNEMDSFSAFQAVLYVFEFAATYLLCMVNPSRAIAIPWSWAMLHLPQFIRDGISYVAPDNEQQQSVYGNCLINLIDCFCALVDRLEWAMKCHTIAFNCAGRRNMPPVAIRRRNTDFLTVVALNLGSASIPVRGFAQAWAAIQKVLAFSAPPGFMHHITLQNLQRDFTRSFEIYGDKDSLHVVTLNDADTCPLYLRGFIVNGATLVKLCTVLEITHESQEAPGFDRADDDNTNGENYSELESEMVTKLQRRWRCILPRIREARNLRQTPRGTAIASLLKLCANSFPSDCHSSVKIAVRAILFTDGIYILAELDAILGSIRKLHTTWKSFFESTTSTTQLELLDSVRVNILKCESMVSSLRRTWSVNCLQESPLLSRPRELKESASNALHTLKVTWHEIGNAMQNLVNLEDYN